MTFYKIHISEHTARFLRIQLKCHNDFSSENHYFAQLFDQTKPQNSHLESLSAISVWTKHDILKMFNIIWSEEERQGVGRWRRGKRRLKHMKHPLEGIFSFLSLVLTKLYFSEHGEGNSLRVRGLWRLMPMEYAWQEMPCLYELVTDVWRVGQAEKIAPSWMQPPLVLYIWTELCCLLW